MKVFRDVTDAEWTLKLNDSEIRDLVRSVEHYRTTQRGSHPDVLKRRRRLEKLARSLRGLLRRP